MKIRTVIVGLILLFLIWVLLPLSFIKLNNALGLPVYDFRPLKLIGLLLIGIAVSTDIYLFYLFKVYGKGTPVPVEPSKKVIETGLYKYTRNPMYLGHLTIYLGLFLYFGYLTLLILFLLAAAALHILVSKWEEPDLKKRLGKEYTDYLQKVPRWI